MGTNIGKVARKAAAYRHVLLLMRHAKAEMGDGCADRERELSDKGRKQAKAVGKGLVSMGLVPDAVSCSGAVRARQTLERLLRRFGDKPKVAYRHGLYEGGIDAVMQELSQAKDSTRVLMVVGHEPTMSMCCQWLASHGGEPSTSDRLHLGLSTGAVVVFGSDTPFARWGLHEGDVLAVLSPKDFD